MRLSASDEDIVRLAYDSDMLPQRCPEMSNCVCAEEAAAQIPIRLQMRLLSTARLISVSIILLLVMVLAILVLLLFGSRASSHQSKELEPSPPNLSEARREKQQSAEDLPHSSALLTITERKPFPEWQGEDGNAHITGHMTVSDGNLSVPTEGLYRLYLQVTFGFDHKQYEIRQQCEGSDPICDKDLMSLQIYVQSLSKSYMSFRTLLFSEETMSCSHDWTKTMTTTGTFLLDAGTKLRVQLLHSEFVIDQDTRTFFGAELIFPITT
ncbi:hypothetical protein NL108_011063 [Boleophthalmus pectinirostris]|uniref:uncharacterized protein LOC110163293 n=1 Tax=Boleophthalmus pectinirostris TaxID=150288 RepID=UPI00242CA8AE|nr:uncharacterized protein LOC110163293 [Boleophthalmus pectinirostris]KAJ0067833.1 hypothetical protein NL108_011063 [Boleophthalmus pectinirostris]